MMLAAALVALILGVAAVPVLKDRPRAMAALDGFVLMALAGIIGLHLVPESLAVAGWPAAALVVVGLGPPRLLEGRHDHDHEHREPWSVVAFAALGLGVHAFLDGGALAVETIDPDHGRVLALGVVLHRLPMGVVLGILGATRGRMSVGWAAASLVAVATVLGYGVGVGALGSLGHGSLALLQALVAGTLAHVVLSRHDTEETARKHTSASAVGALVGIGVSVLILADHPPHEGGNIALGAVQAFVGLGLETAMLLVAFLGAGLPTALLRAGSPCAWIARGQPATQALKGVAVGLPVPVCSCGVLPVYQGLVSRGVPAAAALAFLVATPELGVDAVLLSLPLLGGGLTVARILAAFAVAWVVGTLLGAFLGDSAQAHAEPEQDDRPLVERVKNGLWWSLTELADHLLPWMVLGLAIAAIAEPLLADGALAALPRGLQVPAAALVGLPIYVCASGSTPIAAVLLHKGLSPGAALAFLLAGPATNATTFGVVRQTYGTRGAIAFGALVAGGAMVAGFATDAVLVGSLATVPPLADVDGHGPIAWVALVGLLGLAATSLFRQGPRGWIEQLVGGGAGHHHDEHDHDHEHHHEHHHDHDHGHHHHG